MSERFYIHCADDNNKQLFDTESDFNIHIEEVGSDEELIQLCNLLNEQQATINNQEQRIKILQQEISDTQAVLEMLTEKLKGWNDERKTI